MRTLFPPALSSPWKAVTFLSFKPSEEGHRTQKENLLCVSWYHRRPSFFLFSRNPDSRWPFSKFSSSPTVTILSRTSVVLDWTAKTSPWSLLPSCVRRAEFNGITFLFPLAFRDFYFSLRKPRFFLLEYPPIAVRILLFFVSGRVFSSFFPSRSPQAFVFTLLFLFWPPLEKKCLLCSWSLLPALGCARSFKVPSQWSAGFKSLFLFPLIPVLPFFCPLFF